MALHKDDNIDAFILIDGEAVENECEWKGLTQTMKKEFVKENDKTKREIEKVREEMKLTNDKVDIFKVEVTAQLSQITTLIKGLSQREWAYFWVAVRAAQHSGWFINHQKTKNQKNKKQNNGEDSWDDALKKII